MGLDMYLKRRVWFQNRDKHNDITAFAVSDTETIDISKVESFIIDVGYWRKANAIHKWFVDNIQEGNDNCGNYDVSGEKLIELRKLCIEIRDNWKKKKGKDIAKEELPTLAGFFFGGTNYDDAYLDDINNTIEILKDVKPAQHYIYSSSW